mgnify:CR=1 FL=1
MEVGEDDVLDCEAVGRRTRQVLRDVTLRIEGRSALALDGFATEPGTFTPFPTGEAAEIIRRGDAELMLAGGTEAAIHEATVGGFASMKALSTRNDDPAAASRPFDRDRDGFVMGEGGGFLVLESRSHAAGRGAAIRAELAGIGTSGDAFHMVIPSSEPAHAARAIPMLRADAEEATRPFQAWDAASHKIPY